MVTSLVFLLFYRLVHNCNCVLLCVGMWAGILGISPVVSCASQLSAGHVLFVLFLSVDHRPTSRVFVCGGGGGGGGVL